jgi:hypothetical protein
VGILREKGLSPCASATLMKSHGIKLSHNIGACAPSWTTPPDRPWFWIASRIKRKTPTLPAHASDARSADGRPERKTAGFVAVVSGIRSTPAECAPPVFTSGLQLSASRVSSGRRIRSGMLSEKSGANDRNSFGPQFAKAPLFASRSKWNCCGSVRAGIESPEAGSEGSSGSICFLEGVRDDQGWWNGRLGSDNR